MAGTEAETIREKKAEVRKAMRRVLKAFCSTPEYTMYSSLAAGHFLESELYRNAALILAFVSLKSEIDTHPLIETLLRNGKSVAVPVCAGNDLEFRLLEPALPLSSQLSTGAFNIEEPVSTLHPVIKESLPADTVMLVPGLAFSADGKRLGKGKGFYDRCIESFIAHCPTLKLAGFTFSFQLQIDIPSEPHDRLLDYIITEKGIIKS